MPRNPAGVYTLPNPPVVSGDPILSSDENTTRQDFEAEMTFSLDRNGRGPMLAPVRVPDGTNAVPTYSFTSETNSGWYRKSAGEFWFAVGALDVLRVTAAGVGFATGKAILAADGTLAAPGIAFANEPGMGIYRAAAGQLTFAVGGVQVFNMQAASVGSALPSSWAGAMTLGSTLVVAGNAGFALDAGVAGTLTAGSMLANNISTVGTWPSNAATGLYNSGVIFSAGTSISDWASTFAIKNRHGNGSLISTYEWNKLSGSTGYHSWLQIAGTHVAQPSMTMFLSGPHFGGAGLGAGFWPRHSTGDIGGKLEWEYSVATPATTFFRLSIARGGTVLTAGDYQINNNSFNCPQHILRGGMTPTLTTVNRAGVVIDGSTYAMNAVLCFDSASSTDFIQMEHVGTFYWGYEGGPGPIGGWSMSLSAAGALSSANYTPVSDADTKFDIRPINNALADVLRLRGVRFKQRHDSAESMGLVAQEVRAVFPELVGIARVPEMDGNPGRDLLTLNYNALTGALVEAIRELTARVTALETV